MCNSCGCGDPNDSVTIRKPGEQIHQHIHSSHERDHHHDHHHDHDHDHDHSHDHTHEIQLEQDILQKNNLLAERNRGYFEAKNILALNMVSSPGSGKTSLLERTIHDLNKTIPFYVIEGDQQTMNDAERIEKTGAPVIQVNTGSGCHLDANMVNQAAKSLDIKEHSILFIENVGNLVCPAMFDLGESRRVVVMSVTEGEDKPIKYPVIFQNSDICIINKMDLLPHLNFDLEKAKEYTKRVNPNIQIITTSVTSGDGMNEWFEWLKKII